MSALRPYTHLMLSGELSILRCLHGMIENDAIETRDEFGDLMKAAFEHGRLDPRALADDLGYSISTVYRWIEARSAPHPSLWPRVVEWTLGALSAKIADHDLADANAADADIDLAEADTPLP